MNGDFDENIATGKTSQAITPFQFFDYFHFFDYLKKLTFGNYTFVKYTFRKYTFGIKNILLEDNFPKIHFQYTHSPVTIVTSVKFSVGFLTHRGHISKVSIYTLTHWQTDSLTYITSRASCDTKEKEYEFGTN